MVSSLVDLTRALVPAVDASCRKNSVIGCHTRAQMALRQLHTVDKKFEYTDQLMVCIVSVLYIVSNDSDDEIESYVVA